MTTKVNLDNYSNIIYLMGKFKIYSSRDGVPFNKIYKKLVDAYGFEP